MILQTRKLEAYESKDVIFKRIQHNGYFFPPKNVLLYMICDESPHIRRLGWKRINKSRINEAHIGHKRGVRVFELPKKSLTPLLIMGRLNGQHGSLVPSMTSCIMRFHLALPHYCEGWLIRKLKHGPIKLYLRSTLSPVFHVIPKL